MGDITAPEGVEINQTMSPAEKTSVKTTPTMTRRHLGGLLGRTLVALGLMAAGCTPTKGTQTPESAPATLPPPTEYPSVPNPEEVRRNALQNEIWGKLKQIEKRSQLKFSDLSLEENRTLYWQVDTSEDKGMNVRAFPETSSPNIGTVDERGIIRGQYILSLKTTGPDKNVIESKWLILEKTDSEGNPQEGDPTQEAYPLKEKDPMHIIPGQGGSIKSQIDGQGFLFVCINEGNETYLKPWNNTGANLRGEASVRP